MIFARIGFIPVTYRMLFHLSCPILGDEYVTQRIIYLFRGGRGGGCQSEGTVPYIL